MPKKYIDANNTLSSVDKAIKNYAENDDVLEFISEIRYAVIGQPTADVKEVRHGEWIEDTSPHRDLRFVCNKCKAAYATPWIGVDNVSYTVGNNDANYCPNCGAKMDGKGKTE